LTLSPRDNSETKASSSLCVEIAPSLLAYKVRKYLFSRQKGYLPLNRLPKKILKMSWDPMCAHAEKDPILTSSTNYNSLVCRFKVAWSFARKTRSTVEVVDIPQIEARESI
jgi:hypothetical protein